MSDRTMEAARRADQAAEESVRKLREWRAVAEACARIRGAAPDGPLPGWLIPELEAIPEKAFQDYQESHKAHEEALKAYIAACDQERPYLKEQAAARAAERVSAARPESRPLGGA